MEYKTFERKICRKVQEIIGDSACVQVEDVIKNNGIVRRGMTILRKGYTVLPTIFLESYYQMLIDGENLDIIARKILKLNANALPSGRVDMEFFKDFEQVKGRIVYRLVNRERNRELLADVPHVNYLHFAICFCYSYWHPELGDGMILIHNSHMKGMWNTGVEELMRLANDNTPHLMPARLTSIQDALTGILDDSELDGIRGIQMSMNRHLYVLSNPKRYMGAATILYPEIWTDVAAQLLGNFYILPCNVNEVLIMQDNRHYNGEFLHREMVAINSKNARKEDILYDYAYHYDVSSGVLSEMR